MRILLDACVPKRLAIEILGHDVSSVHDLGWGDMDDGPLLDMLAGDFHVFVTVDKGIPAQQQLDQRAFATIVLRAKSNRLEDLKPLVPQLRELLVAIEPGVVYEVKLSSYIKL